MEEYMFNICRPIVTDGDLKLSHNKWTEIDDTMLHLTENIQDAVLALIGHEVIWKAHQEASPDGSELIRRFVFSV